MSTVTDASLNESPSTQQPEDAQTADLVELGTASEATKGGILGYLLDNGFGYAVFF